MASSYRDATFPTVRSRRGTGSIRERSPGVWEVRVVSGFGAVRAYSVQRSFTVRGDAEFAERRRLGGGHEFGLSRIAYNAAGAARLSLAELLVRFFKAPDLWKPATVVLHRSVVKALMDGPLGRRRPIALTAGDVRGAICRWQADGSAPTVSARWLVLRSAMSWAVVEDALRSHPLAGMRGPTARHHNLNDVRWILRTAERTVESAGAALDVDRDSPAAFGAEQSCCGAAGSGFAGPARGARRAPTGRPGRPGADD